MYYSNEKLHALLEEKYALYNQTTFIESDPISIPHQFAKKEDIEIAGFITATIAWGQRKAIIRQAKKIMAALQGSPYNFIMNASEKELYQAAQHCIYRTFNPDDALAFLYALRNIYRKHNGLEAVFLKGYQTTNQITDALIYFREVFFTTDHLKRTQKHVANIQKGSSGKRLNMYLRWMVRKDDMDVDFGLWKKIKMADLMLPLDVHTGNTSRLLGLLNRKQNDWKSVEEVTAKLRTFSPDDPIKYDFSLFGIGVFEGVGKLSQS